MSDKELLEAAAKAAGIPISQWEYEERSDIWMGARADSEEATVYWNPLTDDGDAFRLQVYLRLHITTIYPAEDGYGAEPLGMIEVWQEDKPNPVWAEYFKRGEDRVIVIRHAIVRAAAQLGKQLNEQISRTHQNYCN